MSRQDSAVRGDSRSGSVSYIPRLTLIALCAVYCGLYNWSYANVESTLFAYQGHILDPPGALYTLCAYVLALLPGLWLPCGVSRPFEAALILLYATWYVPTLFTPLNYVNQHPGIVAPVIVSAVAFWLLRYVGRIKVPRVRPPRISDRLFWLTLLAACVGLTLVVGALNGFRLNLTIDMGYSRRLAARDTLGSGSLAGYAIAWLGASVAPLAIAYGLVAKRRLLALAGCVGMVTIFSFTGAKLSVVTAVMLMGLLLILRKFRNTYGLVLIGVFIALIGLSAFRWVSSEDPLLSEMFTRRVVGSKGVSLVHYWELFRNDPVYMRDSKISALLGQPREEPKTFRAGRTYRSLNTNYNANAWATGFADFGYLGILLVSVIVGICLRLLDGFAKYGDADIHCLMASSLAIIWGEQALVVSMLTSGVIVTLGFLYLLSGTRRCRNEQEEGEALTQGA